MGRPPLYGRRSRRRAVRDPPRTVRSDAGRYAARRFHPLDAHRDAGLPDRLLQKRLRARRGLGRHDRRGQAQSAYRGRRAAIHRQARAAAQPIALRHTLVAIPLAPHTTLVGDTDPAVRTRAAEYRAGRRRPAPDSLRYDPAAASGFLRLRTARLPPLSTQNQE